MGVFDKFLDIMKLNDDDYDDDEFYDDDDFADDGDFEENRVVLSSVRRIIKRNLSMTLMLMKIRSFSLLLPARLHQCVLLQNTAETWKYAL